MHLNEPAARPQELFTHREYKDRLFIRCFRDKVDLLDLYNAVRGSSYTNPDDLEITTLEDCIYMSMKNDVSFIISSQMCLFEHQSTVNPNMPVRGFLYFARLYDAYITKQGYNIHGSGKIKLPLPCYCVFYNGNDDIPDISYLRLSDLFCKIETNDTFADHPIALECVATMFNINYGHNEKLMASCRQLRDYSRFVSEVKSGLEDGLDRSGAIDAAVDYCIENDILRDFLKKNRSEVYDMLLTHFDEQIFIKGIREEGFEDGFGEGLETGENRGEQLQLIKLVCLKYSNGQSTAKIAEDLIQDEILIANICRAAEPFAPDYDAKAIFEYINKNTLQ